jgi:hypothetical protein
MSWLRSNRFGTWCALFALAVQLVLSFGHVHRGGPTRPFAQSFLAGVAIDQAAAAMPAGGSDLPRPADFGFDYCGICTVNNLVGAGVLPATPALPLPPVVDGGGPWESIEFASTPLRHFIFEARAPPQA